MSIGIILLAAGNSSRCHPYKLTLPYKGKPLFINALETCLDVTPSVYVISGYHQEEIEGVTHKYPIQNLFNPNYQEGMFGSIKWGLKHVKEDSIFILPGDHPLIKKSTFETMLTHHGDCIIPTYNGRKGHPLLIKSSLIPTILSDSTLVSMQDFIHKHPVETVNVLDEGVQFDIDTYDDYVKLLQL